MSTGTKIEWTHHTFNPWWGCTKVHAGCTNCYAEALDKRWGGDHWGNGPRRMVLGEWGKPAKWNAEYVKLAHDRISKAEKPHSHRTDKAEAGGLFA